MRGTQEDGDGLPFAAYQVLEERDGEGVRSAMSRVFGMNVQSTTSNEPGVRCQGRWHRLDETTSGWVEFGADASLTLHVREDSYVLVLPSSGRLLARLSDDDADLAPGSASVLSGGDRVALHVSGECRLWIIRVPRRVMRSVLCTVVRGALSAPLRFQWLMDLTSGYGRTWLEQAMFIQREIDRGGALLDDLQEARHLEWTLVRMLLRAQPNTYSDRMMSKVAPTLADGYEMVEETWPEGLSSVIKIIHDVPELDHSAASLAAHANVSLRTLQKYFRRYLGETPKRYLRNVRLDRVHHELLAAYPTKGVIERVMYDAGISSLSHFATYYRDRFGETPGDTVRRSVVSTAENRGQSR